MQSHTTGRFWKCFNSLPPEIQKQARQVYKIWTNNPNHPSLHFKQISNTGAIYSIRIGLHHRAIGIKESKTMIWFWVGTHEEYNNLVSRL